MKCWAALFLILAASAAAQPRYGGELTEFDEALAGVCAANSEAGIAGIQGADEQGRLVLTGYAQNEDAPQSLYDAIPGAVDLTVSGPRTTDAGEEQWDFTIWVTQASVINGTLESTLAAMDASGEATAESEAVEIEHEERPSRILDTTK